MIAILFNVLAVLVGSAIGALAKRGITEKYITVLNTAMGLAALVLGVNVAMSNMNKSHFPALFIFCLALGGLLGTVLRLDERMQEATRRVSKNGSNLTEGITTGVLFCCVGTLSMMGPVLAALKGDHEGGGLELWFLGVHHRFVCLPVAGRNLWYCQTFGGLHFRCFDLRSLDRGRCADCCRRFGCDEHQRLQDHQLVAGFAHADALFLVLASPRFLTVSSSFAARFFHSSLCGLQICGYLCPIY